MDHLEKLLIVARVAHYRHDGKFWAYTPYAREIEVWAELFPHVTIAGTLREEKPPGDCCAFVHPNITVISIKEAGGNGARTKVRQLLALPKIIRQLAAEMRGADAIHVRCPCDLGLLGVVMGPLYSRHLIAKYATQWLSYPGEPFAWKLQRALLRSLWWRGPLTVYGEWKNQPPKVVPFFTSMLTEEQIRRAKSAAAQLRDPNSFRVLFVGRLSKSKNVDVLLHAVSRLKVRGAEMRCTIVGEGPERSALERLARKLLIRDRIVFTGGLDFDDVLDLYAQTDALVLASDIEGWPKAIAEGMAFGAVCIGSARGVVPQMLGDGRGLLVPPRDETALTEALQWIVEHREATAAIRARAASWAQQYSLEGLKTALTQLMAGHWKTSDAGKHVPPRLEPISK